MNKFEITEKLKNHKKWLNDENGGKRANFSGDDLGGAHLRYVNFRYANFSDANLNGVDFSGAVLSGVDFYGANLIGANFSRANLSEADFSDANLSGANFYGANLIDANFSGANLRYASYEDTILNYQCPEEGEFIAFKKLDDDVIAKIKITEKSKRSSATSRKCRAEEVEVLEFLNSDLKECPSKYDENFIYKIGETIKVDDFDDDRWNECLTGIHFFITKKEAEEY